MKLNIHHKNSILCVGILLIVIGVLFILLENVFYQYVDENGILHESLFLPLGVVSTLLGFIVILVNIFAKTCKFVMRRIIGEK